MRQPDERASHLPALDGLRGVAILLVLADHFFVRVPGSHANRVLELAAKSGWIGVDLFFVLSGFLITGILLDAKGEPHYFRNYLARRTLRIFPLYYGYLTVMAVLLSISVGPWLWTYTSNVYIALHNGPRGLPPGTLPFWSLAVEEQFYLLWPLVIYRLDRIALRRVLAGLIIGATLTRVVLQSVDLSVAAYVLMPARMDLLAVGGLIALDLRERGIARLARNNGPLFALSALILVVVVWRSHDVAFFHDRSRIMQLVGYPALAMGAAATIIHVLAAPRSPVTRLAARGLLPFIGRYSYGVYVLHIPVRRLLQWPLSQRWQRLPLPGLTLPLAVFVALAAISVLVALASYHAYEKPFLRLKRFFVVRKASFDDMLRAAPPGGAGPV